ncbi:MAG: imelysin family protein [Saprospiraceae bacterium]
MKKISQLGLALFFATISTVWIGCGDDMPNPSADNDQFDRSVMLEHWVDGFIIPGYKSYLEAIDSMDAKAKKFVADPNISRLNDLRNNFRFAYNAWQEVSMFEIGRAEELALRKHTNIYPTNREEILSNIISETYNLTLPSTFDQQGFPAIEFLIYAVSETDILIVDQFNSNVAFKTYLTDLTTKMTVLTREVYTNWTTGYREVFIEDAGSSASSSVNRMVNDYLFYYERYLRSAKIGIPAGVFSGSPLTNNVEALNVSTPTLSKSLYLNSLTSFKDFFDGKSKYNGNGPSLSEYLGYIQILTSGANISRAIEAAIDNAIEVSNGLDDDFKRQVEEDNTKMLATYDALQVVTVLMKTDMLSALNVSIDYVDADGD